MPLYIVPLRKSWYNWIHDVWGYKDTVQHWGGYGIRLDGGRGAQGNSNCDIHNNIVFNTSSSSIGIWGIPRSGDNYDDSLINAGLTQRHHI